MFDWVDQADELKVTMRAPRPPTLRFTRLKLMNWRNFRTVDMHLEARAFIVGPNASGKSNLLDAFRFLAEVARPGSGGSGGLQAAIESRDGFSALRCLHARNPPDVQLEVFVGTSEIPELWHYLLQINRRKRERIATVFREEIAHNGTILQQRSRSESDDALAFSQTFLEQVGMNLDFRAFNDFLSSARYLHVVPQIVRDRTRAKADGDDPYGGDLLRRMKDMPKKMRAPRLRLISAALGIAVPQFVSVDLEDDADGVPHLLASFRHWRAAGSRQSEVYFSDGTLRLIGLLWSIAENGGPLLLEEPELSLNDAVIRELPLMFRRMQGFSGRQVITTTHSSAMLDDGAIGLKEVHRISVDSNGSKVETIADNQAISARIEAGMTTSEAVIPMLAPTGIEQLGRLDIAS